MSPRLPLPEIKLSRSIFEGTALNAGPLSPGAEGMSRRRRPPMGASQIDASPWRSVAFGCWLKALGFSLDSRSRQGESLLKGRTKRGHGATRQGHAACHDVNEGRRIPISRWEGF